MKKELRDLQKIKNSHTLFKELEKILNGLGIYPNRSLLNEFNEWRILHEWKLFEQERMDKYIVEKTNLNSLILSFPNGKKREYYEKSISLDLTNYQEVWIENLEPTGLEYDINWREGKITLKGIPQDAKDFEFILHVKLKGWQDGDPVIDRSFRIAFNPDPRDLWKPKEVPANIVFPKVDEASNYVLVEEFEGRPQKDIVAASKRGRSHAQEGKPRDDDFKISFNGASGWYILAVADGAGSAKYSREGSRIACETVEEYCKNKLVEEGEIFEELIRTYEADKSQENLNPLVAKIHEILFKAATEAHKNIVKRVEECSEPPAVLKDFSTTLLFAICRKFEFGWFIASFGVGDGAIGLYSKDSNKIKLLNEPDGGEYAGQTRFVTMESIFKDRTRIKMTIVPDFTALILMTDGISDPMFETDANLAKKEKWDELWANLSKEVDFSDDNEKSQYQLLDWLDFWSPGNHDDRTIAILY